MGFQLWLSISTLLTRCTANESNQQDTRQEELVWEDALDDHFLNLNEEDLNEEETPEQNSRDEEDEALSSTVKNYLDSIFDGLKRMSSRDKTTLTDKEAAALQRKLHLCLDEDGPRWLHPPHPIRKIHSERKPDAFYLPSVYLWDPTSLLAPGTETSIMDCRKCRAKFNEEKSKLGKKASIKCTPSVLKKSWYETPRRVFDLKGVYYIFSTRLRCHRCGTDLAAFADTAMSYYPTEVLHEFPAVLSQRSGLDKNLLSLLQSLCDKGVGPVTCSSILKEMYTLE